MCVCVCVVWCGVVWCGVVWCGVVSESESESECVYVGVCVRVLLKKRESKCVYLVMRLTVSQQEMSDFLSFLHVVKL